jgi:CBS domain containing-hemolysin-like protein
MLLLLLSCTVAIVVSFLCSVAEAVLLSLNPIRLETLKNEGSHFAAAWLRMKQNVGRPIAAILILNTVAHTGGATVAGAAFDELYGEKWLWLFSTVFTVVVLFGTEIVPKVLGVAHNERLAPLIAPPLALATAILRPAIWVTELVSKRLGGSPHDGRITVADIMTLAGLARAGEVIGPEQEAIIRNVLRFHHTTVRDVMIPRERIVYFRETLPMEENLKLAREVLHTRYPVSTTDDVDGITGFVNIKRVMADSTDFTAASLSAAAWPLLSVAPELTLLELSRRLAVERQHMALVRDATGRIVGLVTLEDFVSEVMG